MRIDHPRTGIKSGIGNPRHPHFAVVVRNIFDQPLDRVPGIATLIDFAGFATIPQLWPHFHEFPLGHPSPPNVLIDKNVARFGELLRRPQIFPILVHPIRFHTIRGSSHHHWIGFCCLFWHINRCKESNPITHRDAILVFGVVRFDELETLSVNTLREPQK